VLGILACFRKKLPSGAFTFIAGIAIIDDLITLSIIALFYSHSIHPDYLIIAAFLFSLSIFFNYCGIRKPFIYLLIGLATWYVISLAGIHGSIAGILIALTVPARPKRGPRYAIQRIQKLVYSFEIREKQEPLIFSDQQQHYILEDLQTTAKYSTTPLQHWRSLLEPFIAFFVLPLFIFCNAGIHINIHLIAEALSHWMSLSIFLSLIFGKFIGVTLFSKLSLLLKLGKLPKDTSFNHIMILAIISGVGFTTAIFTSVLSFSDGSHELALAKISILLASIICTITGITLLSITKGKNGGCNHEKFTPKSHSLSRHLLSRIWLY
jgi:NhaA family Na+:H+ antiporter